MTREETHLAPCSCRVTAKYCNGILEQTYVSRCDSCNLARDSYEPDQQLIAQLVGALKAMKEAVKHERMSYGISHTPKRGKLSSDAASSMAEYDYIVLQAEEMADAALAAAQQREGKP